MRSSKRERAHQWGTPPWQIKFRPAAKPLPRRADFVVVGGGFSGLSAAAWLSRLAPTKSVLVLERARLGDGSSGRTGGMTLAETAAGTLPGLGDVLRGYQQILRQLGVEAELSLPGAYELARKGDAKESPIHWTDSGDLRAVKKVPGGTVNPGKVAAGLARAAQSAGAQIIEHAEVFKLEAIAEGDEPPEIQLRIRVRYRGKVAIKIVRAGRVLLATMRNPSISQPSLPPLAQN